MRIAVGSILLLALSLTAGEPPLPRPPAAGAPTIRLGNGFVVLYPVPDQQNVATTFPGNEYPDPIPKAKTIQAGYPITVTFDPKMKITAAKGKLLDDRGQEVAGWFSSPIEPANKDYKPHQQNTLCYIATKPLSPGSTFAVQMEATVDGAFWRKNWKFTTMPEGDPVEDVPAVLARMNAYRKAAGLEPVELEKELSKACQAHARYLARNLIDNPNLPRNEEDPSLPGYTEAGKKVGKVAVVLRGRVEKESIEFMFGDYHNRSIVLFPGLKKIGFGVAPNPGGGQIWVMEYRQFSEGIVGGAVVRFPGPDQKDVRLAYPGGSSKHPVEDVKEREKAGYAVSALFWPPGEFRDVRTRMTKRNGFDVEHWRSTPSEPAVKGTQQFSITLISKKPLEPGTTYDISMSATRDGKPWESAWAFATEPADAYLADKQRIEKLTLDLLNAYRTTCGLQSVKLDPRLSAGCEKHAQYLRLNLNHPSTEGLGMHNEDPKLPGYSPEGAIAGKAGVITVNCDPHSAIPAWIDTLYHRVPLIEPNLRRVGFGYVPLADGRWICVMHGVKD